MNTAKKHLLNEPHVFHSGKLQWMWVAVHLAMHLFAICALFYFSFEAFMLFLIAHYAVMLFGITIGYHRMLSHRSFKTYSWLESLFCFFGILSFQGGPKMWAAIHRTHHSLTNETGDAHSAKNGFFWAHQKWMWHREPNGFSMIKYRSKIKDLDSNKFINWIDKNFLTVNLIIFVLGLICLPLDIFLWMFPFRIVFGWHTTWLVNSVAHNVYPWTSNTDHLPQNNRFISIFTCGEGFHKNHHDHPSSPSFEKQEKDFDVAYRFLRLLEYLKLVKLNKTTNTPN